MKINNQYMEKTTMIESIILLAVAENYYNSPCSKEEYYKDKIANTLIFHITKCSNSNSNFAKIDFQCDTAIIKTAYVELNDLFPYVNKIELEILEDKIKLYFKRLSNVLAFNLNENRIV